MTLGLKGTTEFLKITEITVDRQNLCFILTLLKQVNRHTIHKKPFRYNEWISKPSKYASGHIRTHLMRGWRKFQE